jgi:hypothetical protein
VFDTVIMQRIIERVAFAHVLVELAALVGLYVVLLLGRPLPDLSPKLLVTIVATHMGNFIMAIQPSYLRPWRPIVDVSKARLNVARALLALGTLIVMAHVVRALMTTKSAIHESDLPVLLACVAAAALWCLYLCCHWMFRPENILPPWMFVALNPVMHALARFRQRRPAALSGRQSPDEAAGRRKKKS